VHVDAQECVTILVESHQGAVSTLLRVPRPYRRCEGHQIGSIDQREWTRAVSRRWNCFRGNWHEGDGSQSETGGGEAK
jgi:hypothetical protein